MRVLIVNKFYYPRGGDCMASLNLEELLKGKGHEVAFFSMRYSENIHSDFEEYFVSEVNFSAGIKDKLKAAERIFGWGDIKKSFAKILNDFKPEIVHLQNIHSYISPVVAKMAKDFGCRVAWTLHDYKLLCPSYACLRNGKPCELCYTNKYQVIKKRCMKGSLTASVLAYLEAKKWSRKELEKYVDVFICPSEFLASKMRQGGFSAEKLIVISNFVANHMKGLSLSREDCYCYIGRLSKEKGVETLLRVASELPYKLKLAGDGPLAEQLKSQYALNDNIEFLGKINSKQVSGLLSTTLFSVMPSECYDNNPLGVIESLFAGTPVLGANIGGIPELINTENGMLFESGDATDLKQKIERMFRASFCHEKIQVSSLLRFSAERYYEELMKVYKIVFN